MNLCDTIHHPIAVRRRDVDDADATARLDAIFVDFGALPEALFGDREQRAARLAHFHRGHVVVVSQRDAAGAVGGPAHRADVALLEPDGHAVPGADEDLAAAIADLHGDHGIAVFPGPP